MSKYGREYPKSTKFDIGDLVIETSYLTKILSIDDKSILDILANISVIQRVQKGKNCKYYYTIHPYKHPLDYATLPNTFKSSHSFRSISNYNEDRWELANERLADKYPEYFV